VDCRRERDARHRERREWRSEEFRLHEQQGLSSPETEEYSSSNKEEEEEGEEDRGQGLPDRWELAPRHRSRLRWRENRRLGRTQRRLPLGSLRQRRRDPRRRQCAPRRHLRARRSARAVEVAGGAVAAAPATPTTSAGASRKRKRAFSSLR
jgi:hypothetical protein